MSEHRIFGMKFSDIYLLYVSKATRKGRTETEVMQLIKWLTGYSEDEIKNINTNSTTLKDFFLQAPGMNKKRDMIKGSICGVKVEEIENPIMKNIRQLDKIIDELARGKLIDAIQRK